MTPISEIRLTLANPYRNSADTRGFPSASDSNVDEGDR
jgi:hypothetical protein